MLNLHIQELLVKQLSKIIFLYYRSKSPSGKKGIKQVHLHKHDADELGMAILGGLEHGLPIIISEVFPNSAVGRCKKIYAGEDFFKIHLTVCGIRFIS